MELEFTAKHGKGGDGLYSYLPFLTTRKNPDIEFRHSFASEMTTLTNLR